MANAKKAAMSTDAVILSEKTAPPTVTISVKDAERIYDLFHNVECADGCYHTCQAHLFRQQIQGVYKAPNVEAAFERLDAAISAAKGE